MGAFLSDLPLPYSLPPYRPTPSSPIPHTAAGDLQRASWAGDIPQPHGTLVKWPEPHDTPTAPPPSEYGLALRWPQESSMATLEVLLSPRPVPLLSRNFSRASGLLDKVQSSAAHQLSAMVKILSVHTVLFNSH